jgi:putative spermidine/putrescine transport system permease protein
MRPSDFVLYTVTAIVLVLILGPLAIVVLTSFSASDYFQFPPPGLSLRWFEKFFSLPNMRGAFILSLELALGASTAAIILGVLAALFVARQRGQASGLLQSLFMAPLVFPTLASLQSFDPTLEEAGQSLGASPLQTFFRITLPLIWPGVLSGWLFAFIVSFGELNTALFLTGPGVTTLPIEIFSYLQFEGSQLVIAAASTLQVGMILLVVLVMERAVGLARIVRS